MNKPIFEQFTDTSLERAKSIYQGRGMEYGDTWRECNFIKMKAVARELGIEVHDRCFRALATAAFLDMKYWRNLGGYKDDSLIDEINYDGFLAEEMKQLMSNKNGNNTPITIERKAEYKPKQDYGNCGHPDF
jgi:hypothetical protein